MAEITIYLVIILCVFISIFVLKRRSGGKKNYPNGPFGLPIVGHLPFFGSYPPKTFYSWWQQYGDVFGIKLGSWNAVVVNKVSVIRDVTQHSNDAFSGRPNFVFTKALTELVGDESLTFSRFTPAYVKQHKLAARALRLFTSGKPEITQDIVSSEASLFVDKMVEQCGSVPGYVKSFVQTMTLRTMHQILFGPGNNGDIDKHVNVAAAFVHDFNEFTGSGSPVDVMPWLRYFMPWKISRLRNILSNIHSIIKEQVLVHSKTFSTDVIRDVTDAILASNADDESDKDRFVLSRARLNLSLLDFLCAGLDTTHSAISWVLLYVTAYPEIQDRVHKEIDQVVKDRKVSLKDKKNLPFTEAVCLEVNRIVAQVPFAVPHSAIMDYKIGDFDIDEGTVVMLNIHSVHHDKDLWGDPECFRPDRFLTDEKTLDADKMSLLLSFGMGRRRCIGEALAKINIFMSFATIMQRCKFIKPSSEVLDLTPVPGLVYNPKDFCVLVNRRGRIG